MHNPLKLQRKLIRDNFNGNPILQVDKILQPLVISISPKNNPLMASKGILKRVLTLEKSKLNISSFPITKLNTENITIKLPTDKDVARA